MIEPSAFEPSVLFFWPIVNANIDSNVVGTATNPLTLVYKEGY